tara:strand:- start:5568 stop:6497 length:930 start_codon:yes stop_codon:yes gene_type:complete
MRIVFFGNPDFCKYSLLSLFNSEYDLVSVVTNIDRKSGRGLNVRPTFVKKKAQDLGVPVIETDDVNSNNLYNKLIKLNVDIFVVVAFSILPDKILNIPKKHSINIHPSLLPKYRGSSPIQYALLNGDSKTGVSIISMNQKVDSGNILGQKEFDIPNDANFGYLYEKLGILGSNLLLEVIDDISKKNINTKIQDHSKKSLAPKIKKNQYKIDFNLDGYSIYNQIRAFDPYPGAYGFINGKRIKIFGLKLHSTKENFKYQKGQLFVDQGKLLMYVGNIVVSISELQIEGKNKISSIDFIKTLNSKEIFIVN